MGGCGRLDAGGWRWAFIVAFLTACGGEFSARDGNQAGAGGSSLGAGGSSGTSGSSSTGGAGGMGGTIVGTGGTLVGTGGRSSGDGGPRADAPLTDSRPLSDAGRDMTTIGDSFCSQDAHTFCSDFDEPSAFAQWTSQALHSGGTVVLSPAQSTSFPNSAFFNSPASPDMSSSEAVLQKSFGTGITTQAHLAFDLQTRSMASLGSSNAVTLSNGSITILIALSETNGQVACNLSVFGGGFLSPPTACPALMMMGKWNHFDMTVTVAGLSVQIQLAQEGLGVTVLYQLPAWMGTVSLGVGSYPGDPTKFWQGYFDNVALDFD